MTNDELKVIASEIVKAIYKEEWDIGYASSFCDDPPDWTDASEEDVIKVILGVLQTRLGTKESA